MKKYLHYIVIAVSLAVFPLTTAMTCTPTQQRLTYNTLATVGQTVNTAYAAYLDQVVAGKATYSVSVANDYNKFQASYNVAVQAASANLATPAPTDLQNLGASIVAAINQLKH